MNCKEARENLEDYLADALDAAARCNVLDHVAQCGRCRSELADMDAFDRRLTLVMGSVAVSPNFGSRVMTRIQGEEAFRVRRVPWMWLAPMLAAACLALAAGLIWMVWRPQHETKVAAQRAFERIEMCEPGPGANSGIGLAFVIGKDGNMPYAAPANIRVKRVVRGVPVLLVDAFPGKESNERSATL